MTEKSKPKLSARWVKLKLSHKELHMLLTLKDDYGDKTLAEALRRSIDRTYYDRHVRLPCEDCKQ